MPLFIYKATDRSSGKIVKGKLYAPTFEEFRALIEEKGLLLLDSYEEHIAQIRGKFSLLYFTEELAFLLGAGYKIDDALTYLEGASISSRAQEIVKDIKDFVVRGGNLYDALKNYPEIFPDYYIALVRAGYEGRATLAKIFEKLRDYLKKEKDRKDAIKKALIYPTILITVSIFALVFLLGWVVPKFVTIFADFEGTLPLPTLILLNITDFFVKKGIYIGGLLVIFVLLYSIWSKTPSGKEAKDTLKLSIPFVRDFTLKKEISRFSFAVFILLESGLRFQEVMRVSVSILTNTALSSVFREILQDIERGISPGIAFSERPFIPRDVSGIVALGEKASMSKAFERISERYDDELNKSLDRALTLIEPITLLVLGGFIGFIVISILLAVFRTSSIILT